MHTDPDWVVQPRWLFSSLPAWYGLCALLLNDFPLGLHRRHLPQVSIATAYLPRHYTCIRFSLTLEYVSYGGRVPRKTCTVDSHFLVLVLIIQSIMCQICVFLGYLCHPMTACASEL
jgi:hypothetical protein